MPDIFIDGFGLGIQSLALWAKKNDKNENWFLYVKTEISFGSWINDGRLVLCDTFPELSSLPV